MLRTARFASCLIALLVGSTPAFAAERIGLYGQWGAFRGDAGCYALRMPESTEGASGAYLSLVVARGGEPQLVARLGSQKAGNASASASVGGRRFLLQGQGRELRTVDARMDKAVVAAIRSSRALSIETVGRDGKAIAHAYDLRGAASAIDAARLACR